MSTPTIFLPGELAPGETREPETNGRKQFRIKCPDGKARWYTRCTTFIDCLSDRTLLERWKQRVLLVGIDKYLNGDDYDGWPAPWPDPDDRDSLNTLADQLFERGDGFLKSRKGTDLHELTQAWDEQRPTLPEHDAPDALDLAAWITATTGPRFDGWLLREQRVVIDPFKVTGTPDGVARYKCLDGKWRNVIVDLKTGSSVVSYDPGKPAMQEAMYAAGELYTDDGSVTGKREPLPDVSREIGLLIHIPQGTGQAHVYELDLVLGWRGIGLARQVREWRNYSKKCLHEVPL